ncbi:MAG: hypothetical protein WC455_24460 [Dehalococcoidia bacterium]|jgi:hypothetical protein
MSPEELEIMLASISQLRDPLRHNAFCEPCTFLKNAEKLLVHIDSLQADLTQSELVIRAKMTCIDEQAREIANLRRDNADLKEYTDRCNQMMRADLLKIEKLQAALIKERFWKIWREGKHTSVREATELAEKQLRVEMPEMA